MICQIRTMQIVELCLAYPADSLHNYAGNGLTAMRDHIRNYRF